MNRYLLAPLPPPPSQPPSQVINREIMSGLLTSLIKANPQILTKVLELPHEYMLRSCSHNYSLFPPPPPPVLKSVVWKIRQTCYVTLRIQIRILLWKANCGHFITHLYPSCQLKNCYVVH